MYTLRIIEETRESKNSPLDRVTTNYELGDSYSILVNGLTKEFDKVMNNMYPLENKNAIRALICGGNGEVYFVEDKTKNRELSYFTMTDSGKTLEKI